MHSVEPLPHQDLVFDLGDPVKWEYLLLGTDKPRLSMVEDEEDTLNEDYDIENLVSLIRLWSCTPCLAAGRPDSVPAGVHVYGRGQSKWAGYRFLKAEGAGLSPHFVNG